MTSNTTYYQNSPQHEQTEEMTSKNNMQKEVDTEEVASFLLSLKHPSVTPEPLNDTGVLHPTPPFIYSFQEHSYVDKTPASLMEEQQAGKTPCVKLLGDSKLVLQKDRDLVPDALFVAMAQMRPCKLTQADRVGCYKSRDIGFIGMSCMHCGGQPGFGRYYPNSIRSLAQTTTSQTILKHIGDKCRFCPAHIREAVNELQREQAEREGLTSGRPRYGSRKVFFQRVWARLHEGPPPEEDDDSSSKRSLFTSDENSNRTPDLDSDSRQSTPASSDNEDDSHGYGYLAAQVGLKRKMVSGNFSAKRQRTLPTN